MLNSANSAEKRGSFDLDQIGDGVKVVERGGKIEEGSGSVRLGADEIESAVKLIFNEE